MRLSDLAGFLARAGMPPEQIVGLHRRRGQVASPAGKHGMAFFADGGGRGAYSASAQVRLAIKPRMRHRTRLRHHCGAMMTS